MDIILSFYFVVIHHCILFKNVNPSRCGSSSVLQLCRSYRALQITVSKFCTSQKAKKPLYLSKSKKQPFLCEKIIPLTDGSVTDVPYRILYHVRYHIHIECNSLGHSLSHNRIQQRTFQSREDFS